MNEDGAHTESGVYIADSLAEFTGDLIARRGIEESNLLFEGQIAPATRALSARTNSIGVGDSAPDFSLPTADAGMWHLTEHLARSKFSSLVVVFYRGTWCPYCNIYLRGLLEAQSLLSDVDSTFIAVSPEAAPVSSGDTDDASPSFPVLIDHSGNTAEQFGLTFEMDDVAKKLLKDYDIDLEKRNADGNWILPVPGTFVIDHSGYIAYAHVDADYRNRPEPKEIVEICRSLQR
jgi:peroxiredoxin